MVNCYSTRRKPLLHPHGPASQDQEHGERGRAALEGEGESASIGARPSGGQKREVVSQPLCPEHKAQGGGGCGGWTRTQASDSLPARS